MWCYLQIGTRSPTGRTIAIINLLVPNIVGPGYRRASTASRVNAAAQGLQGNQILIFTAHVVPTGWVSASRNSWLSDCRVGATFVELIDAKAVSRPMRDRIYKEYPPGKAPERLQRLAGKSRDADGPLGEGGEALKGRFRALPTT
jgi:hypothetical protein